MSNKPGKSKTSSKLSELQAVKLLAVKATEENDHTSIPQLTVSNANIAAIGAKSDLDFLSRRAAYLFKHLPASLKNITSITEFPGNWLKFILLLSFVSGLFSNLLQIRKTTGLNQAF